MSVDKQQSLLTFPCLFPIKVMGEKHPKLRMEVVKIVKKYSPKFKKDMLTERESRQGNYLSFTVMVEVESKAQLDAIYLALTGHPKVKVVL